MRLYKLSTLRVIAGFISFVVSSLVFTNSYSLPQGAQVVVGKAVLSRPNANTLQVNQSTKNALINWQSFNVSSQQRVNFLQPGSTAIIVNRINPNNGVSKIFGTLTANGQVWLLNSAGIWFGPNSHVDVAGLVATTGNITNSDFVNGKYHFMQAANSNGAIVNDGYIVIHSAGLAALVGNGVVNDGSIVANRGTVILGASKEFTIDFNGDQLINFAIGSEVTKAAVDAKGHALSNVVSSTGSIIANGGRIELTASVAGQVLDNAVNMSGVLQANSIGSHNGVIIISANKGTAIVSGKVLAMGVRSGQSGGQVKILGNKVALMNDALIDVSGINGGEVLIGGNAHGQGPEQNANYTFLGSHVVINADALSNGNGGKVVVWSNEGTQFYGTINARGGSQGGDGGYVETSGGNIVFQGQVDTSARHGVTGLLVLDPDYLYIVNGLNGAGDQDANFTGGTLSFAVPNTLNNTISVGKLQALGNTTILLQANNTLTVGGSLGSAATVNLSGLTSNTITLQANSVIFNAGSTLSTGGGSVVVTSATASLGAITTNNGNLSINTVGALTLNNVINTGSGAVALNVNQGGTGANNFAMAANSAIVTTNATANAVTIDVNTAAGGTGGALLSSITTGAGGEISVATNQGGNATGGSITHVSGNLNVGTNGTINLSVPMGSGSSIGTVGAAISTSGSNATVNLIAGSGGAYINNVGTLLMGAISLAPDSSLSLVDSGNLTLPYNLNTGAGSVTLAANNGTLTLNGTITTSSGNINLNANPSASVGDIIINQPITSTAGAVTVSNSRNIILNVPITALNIALTAQQSLSTLSNANALNGLSGTVILHINQGAGTSNFSMDNSGSITTTNTTANAVVIDVNNGGGTGAAILGNISTGNGGTINIATNYAGSDTGGSISQAVGTELNAGANGNIKLAVSATSASNIQSTVFGGNLSLTSGKGGAFVTSINDLAVASYTSNARAPLSLVSDAALTINGAVNAGLITLSANNGITVNNNLNGYGPIVLNANANNNGAGVLTVNNGFTVNSTGYDVAILASDINLNTSGKLSTGAGMLTITATGAGNSIGIGTGAGGTLNLNDAEMANITATGQQIFNAVNGITFNTNYTTMGALTLNADDSNAGTGALTLLGTSAINTSNNPLIINTGTLALNGGTLDAGTSTLTITATGAGSSIGIGTGSGGSINISTLQFAQLIASGKTFNANDGINVTADYISAGPLTFNADYDNDGTGLLNVANGVTLNSVNNLLSITAATMTLNASGTLNSGTGAFILTATSNTANSLGIGTGAGGVMNLTNAQLATQIIANGERTFNGNNGITITTNPANGNAVTTLNADFNNDGVGLLSIANNISIATNNNDLLVTAATFSLGAGSTLDSGTGAFTFTATGISATSVPPSLGLGDGTGAIIAIDNAQWQTQIIATGARTFVGRDGLYVNENLNDGSALTLNADGDNNGIGILTIAPATTISSGNQALNITAATGVLNDNAFNHGTGSLTVNATGIASPSLGLGDTAGGDLNLDNAVLAGSTGANNAGPLTFNARNGITVAYNIPNTMGNTLTYNADSNYDENGTLTVLPGFTINSNNSVLKITAADFSLQNASSLNSGTADTMVYATGSIGIGTAVGTLSISNAELQSITAMNLTLNTNNNKINSTGVTNAAVNNINGTINLFANPNSVQNTATNPNSLGATVNFTGANSNFKSLLVDGASGININSNVIATGSITLGQSADDNLNNITVSGSQSVIAANGITLNNSADWSGASTFTLNADSTSTHVGNLVVAAGTSLGAGSGNLSVITNDLLLNGAINLGANGNVIFTGTGSVGVGVVVGQDLTLNTAKLQSITANNLTVNSGLDANVLVDNANISAANPLNKIRGSVTLNAVNGSAGGSYVTFQNTASIFNALSATANNGVNVNVNLTVTSTMNLTANGVSDVTEAPGVSVIGTASTSTLNLKTASGDAIFTNQGNSFNRLSATSNSGMISYTNLMNQNLLINTSNVGTGDFTVTTVGSGGLTQSGIITAGLLDVNTDTGNAVLNTISNNVSNFEADSNSGNVSFLDNNGYNVLASSVGTANLSLASTLGNITQSGIVSGTDLSFATTAGSVYFGDLDNHFNQVSANTTGGTINYRGNSGYVVGTSSLQSGNLNLFSQNGNITQNGAVTGNALTVTTNTGNLTFNNAGNNFTSFQAASNGGRITYVNLGDLNILSSNVGVQGSLTITSENNSSLNTIGNDAGNIINFTAGGNLALHANTFIGYSLINFRAGAAISGQSLSQAPHLIAPSIFLRGSQVASQTAPIDLEIINLLTNSVSNDASNQTGLGIDFGYNLITTRLLRDTSDQYYEYPLINGSDVFGADTGLILLVSSIINPCACYAYDPKLYRSEMNLQNTNCDRHLDNPTRVSHDLSITIDPRIFESHFVNITFAHE